MLFICQPQINGMIIAYLGVIFRSSSVKAMPYSGSSDDNLFWIRDLRPDSLSSGLGLFLDGYQLCYQSVYVVSRSIRRLQCEVWLP